MMVERMISWGAERGSTVVHSVSERGEEGVVRKVTRVTRTTEASDRLFMVFACTYARIMMDGWVSWFYTAYPWCDVPGAKETTRVRPLPLLGGQEGRHPFAHLRQ